MASIDVEQSFKDNALTPWLASLTCGDVELSNSFSARSVLYFIAGTFPENIMQPPSAYNSTIGLEGYLQLMVSKCKNLTTHTQSPVTRVDEENGLWFVETPAGRQGPFEAVVVNAAPFASKGFLVSQPQELKDILAKFEYFPTRIVIHRDPAFMPADRKYWCVQNAAVAGTKCEGSIWLGKANGTDADLFKSWVNARAVEPQDIITERKFLHASLTPNTIQAIRDLNKLQGQRRSLLCGSFHDGNRSSGDSALLRHGSGEKIESSRTGFSLIPK